MRLPKHIGIIPDGNRRWAKGQGMDKSEGYGHGLHLECPLYCMCRELGIGEMSFYGFTTDNTKASFRPETGIYQGLCGGG